MLQRSQPCQHSVAGARRRSASFGDEIYPRRRRIADADPALIREDWVQAALDDMRQLAPGGRLFAVVGDPPVMTAKVVHCAAPGAFRTVELFETVLAPLVNAEQPPRFRF